MKYEVLRKQFKEYLAICVRRSRLMAKAEDGKLTPERLVACNQEIDRLTQECKRRGAIFKKLEDDGDPAWGKLTRELNLAVKEFTEAQINPHPTMLQKAKKVVGMVSLLIVGTWAIDSWRKR